MNRSIFIANNLNFRIQSQDLLKNLNFAIPSRQITTIIGPSGAGKSTLLKQLNHLLSPSSGQLFYNSREIFQWNPRDLRKEVVYVSQHPYLFPGTVRSNLEYTGPKTEKLLKDILSKVNLGFEFLDRDVEELSSGEAQRVNLARALILSPQVFLLDEPTSNLDIVNQQIVEDLIIDELVKISTIVLISHDIEQMKRVSHHVMMLSEGKMIDFLPIDEFLKKYTEDKIAGFFKDKNHG